jgi:aminoglycoside phosphotransferase (APT) family kinase protein
MPEPPEPGPGADAGQGPAGQTHDLSIDPERGVVTKRFRSWARNEPAREWRALCLLAGLAPGLAPQPLSADLDGHPPAIRMSWLLGAPLGAAVISAPQAQALARSLDQLWRPVPPGTLAPPTAGTPNPVAFTSQVRATLAAAHDLGDDPLVHRARAAAAAWLDSGAIDRQSPAGSHAVLGQGDSNLANFLWDGHQVRLVDFEDSGPSDRAFELALLVEHISAWSDACLDAGTFLALFDLTTAETARLLQFRRLAALFWLTLLRPGSRASRRNPPGTLKRQADRLLALLGH